MRVRASRAAAAVLVVGIAACADAPAPEREGAVASAITGGSDTNQYPFAVSVCVQPTNNTNCNPCSGTLIAPNLVLTARHCLFDSPKSPTCGVDTFGAANGSETSIWVGTNPNAKQATQGWHKSKRVFVPAGDTRVCGADIALVMLDAVIAASEATPVAPVVQYPITDHTRYATDFTAIGFGLSAGCASGSGGRRRIRQEIRLRCIPGDALIGCDSSIAPEEMIAGAAICPGDSGSGAFEQASFNKGTPVVFGINIRGADGHFGVVTRTDSWRSLIVSAALAAAADKGYAAPSWTATVPPPVDAGVADSGKPPVVDAGRDANAPAPVPAAPRALGEACTASEQCGEATCIVDGAGTGTCAALCDPAAPACRSDESCVAVDDIFACRKGTTKTTTREIPGTGGGCAVAGALTRSQGGGGPLELLVLAVLFAARMARRRIA